MKKGWGVEVLREIRCVGAKVGADVELFVLNFLKKVMLSPPMTPMAAMKRPIQSSARPSDSWRDGID